MNDLASTKFLHSLCLYVLKLEFPDLLELNE